MKTQRIGEVRKRANTWTDAEMQILKDEYPTCANPRDLAVKIGRSYLAMRTMARRLQLKRIAPKPVLHGTATEAESEFVRANALTMPVKRMAKELNRSHQFIQDRLRNLGIEVPREVIEGFKADSRIKKGNMPLNKGKAWKEWMSKEGRKNSFKTTFKKGNLPVNTLYDGAIRIRRDKTGVEYLYIRVRLAKWEPLHRMVWRHHRGKIPPRMLIVFKDGNQGNCNIDNLEMISRKENMLRNTYHNYPKEIANLVQLRGALNRQINKHLKALKQ